MLLLPLHCYTSVFSPQGWGTAKRCIHARKCLATIITLADEPKLILEKLCVYTGSTTNPTNEMRNPNDPLSELSKKECFLMNIFCKLIVNMVAHQPWGGSRGTSSAAAPTRRAPSTPRPPCPQGRPRGSRPRDRLFNIHCMIFYSRESKFSY